MTMSWLGVQPTTGDKEAVIDAQPTTTNLPLGTHAGELSFTPTAPFQKMDVGVEYEIYSLTRITEPRSPTTVTLEQNYPNPFSDRTTIRFRVGSLNHSSTVSLRVFDALGRKIATLFEGEAEPGEYTFDFKPHDFGISSLSGHLFVVLRTSNTLQAKMILYQK